MKKVVKISFEKSYQANTGLTAITAVLPRDLVNTLNHNGQCAWKMQREKMKFSPKIGGNKINENIQCSSIILEIFTSFLTELYWWNFYSWSYMITTNLSSRKKVKWRVLKHTNIHTSYVGYSEVLSLPPYNWFY